MTAPNFDREEILRTWHIFRQPGEVLELRIPEAGRYKVISGYFDDPEKLADAVIGLADEPFPGIYFSVNSVKPELLARAANRYAKYAKTTTSDADITALHWLPIDLDAKRPAGISATDAEHEAAISKTWEIMRWLIDEQGWPGGAFVVADSGNGGHLNVKIDLENSQDNVAIIKRCLEALDFLFSDDQIQVDVTSQNPSRIWKLYGTMVRKGDNLPERPHRLARILEVPETRETVTKEKLESLAAMLPAQEEQPKTYVGGQGFDPVSYCQAHDLQVHHTKSYSGGTLAVLEQCVFNPDHRLSACIIGWPSGARTYRCRHHSCLSKHWKEARAAIEGESGLEKNARRLEEIHQEAQRAKGQAWAEGEPGGDPGREMGGEGKEEVLEILPLCDVKELLETFKKWLYVAEDYNIIGPSVAVMANFCPGEPDIIGVIGPSGSIKTELVRSLGETQNQFVYPISSITEHTLVSGHKESRDLLPQLKGRLLTIKDLTSILSKKEEVRSQIFADFREITDGYIRKEFGNGVVKEYSGLHSSILFASTNAIERYYSMYANLGQRIIFLRPRNDSEKARERAFQNRGKQKEMRQELHVTMVRFVSSIKAAIETSGLPLTSEEVQTEMGPFYDFLAIARTPIHRDYRTDEIDEIPEPEFPTRICNTISRLCEVHALFSGREEVGQEDTAFGLRVVLDNIPTRRWQLLRTMPSGWVITSQIATGADMSTDAAKRTLDELISLKLVERWARENKPESMDKRSDSYRISDKWLEIIEELRGVIRCEGTIDNEKEPKRDSSYEEEYTVIKNSPPQSLIIIPCGEEEKTGIGPHPRKDVSTPGGDEEFRALLQFLIDYKTEWPRGNGEYETVSYLVGDECAAPLERAIRWQARGVAKILDVDYLLWEAKA